MNIEIKIAKGDKVLNTWTGDVEVVRWVADDGKDFGIGKSGGGGATTEANTADLRDLTDWEKQNSVDATEADIYAIGEASDPVPE